MAETIVVAGGLAQQRRLGGHAWVFLQYLLGFRRLGYDVLFVDRPTDETGVDATVRTLRALFEPFALDDSFAVLHDGTRASLVQRLRESALLLNVMGYLDDEELLDAAPRRVFLDIDPGFGQMWHELGLADVFAGHDVFVTVGANIGRPECAVPTCGREWIATRQPIVLDEWTPQPLNGGVFTSIGVWRGPYASLEYGGRTYGLRAHEFRKFAALPRRTGRRFDAAFEIHPAETADLALLVDNGWTLVDPAAATGSPHAYRDYVQHAFAEFMVAKGVYVDTCSGWFGDRSICFLASGRPVLAQDTGLAGHYPLGGGLLTFSTLEEAEDGVARISTDYALHARAARALAEEHFDSDRVLRDLLERVA
jgi:hypothetical protein